jgi:hypothetical protein
MVGFVSIRNAEAIGGKFDVGLAVFGTILSVDVVPQQSYNE